MAIAEEACHHLEMHSPRLLPGEKYADEEGLIREYCLCPGHCPTRFRRAEIS